MPHSARISRSVFRTASCSSALRRARRSWAACRRALVQLSVRSVKAASMSYMKALCRLIAYIRKGPPIELHANRAIAKSDLLPRQAEQLSCRKIRHSGYRFKCYRLPDRWEAHGIEAGKITSPLKAGNSTGTPSARITPAEGVHRLSKRQFERHHQNVDNVGAASPYLGLTKDHFSKVVRRLSSAALTAVATIQAPLKGAIARLASL